MTMYRIPGKKSPYEIEAQYGFVLKLIKGWKYLRDTYCTYIRYDNNGVVHSQRTKNIKLSLEHDYELLCWRSSFMHYFSAFSSFHGEIPSNFLKMYYQKESEFASQLIDFDFIFNGVCIDCAGDLEKFSNHEEFYIQLENNRKSSPYVFRKIFMNFFKEGKNYLELKYLTENGFFEFEE